MTGESKYLLICNISLFTLKTSKEFGTKDNFHGLMRQPFLVSMHDRWMSDLEEAGKFMFVLKIL